MAATPDAAPLVFRFCRLGCRQPPEDGLSPASSQVSAVEPRNYRMTRRLTPAELDGIKADSGPKASGCNRTWVASRRRTALTQKMTPALADQAKRLYADGSADFYFLATNLNNA